MTETEAKQCVIAQCANEDKTKLALEVLAKTGFTNENVSVVRSVQQLKDADAPIGGEDLAPEVRPEDSAVASATMVGGALGATVGAVSLVGPLLVVGPLAGVALGAAAGGLLNLIGGREVDRERIESYEQSVAEGSVLIIVDGDATRLNQAERVLRTVNPVSIDRYSVEGG
jgi:uncharacterized membrane protein